MNIYKLLKINRLVRSNRLKLLGILVLHTLKKRYFGVFFDPILSCNLKCQMCYFSDEKKRKEMNGKFSNRDIELIAKKFFPYALKLQIGCGAEPTTFNNNLFVINQAKKYSVPYVSMTTNANLLQKEDLENYIKAGLNEITISLHGVKKATYEFLMQNASYDKFLFAMQFISELKQKYPNFKVRINYTMNSDNVMELSSFFDVFNDFRFDILQLRPITSLGDTTYKDFSWKKLIENYQTTILKVKNECKQRNITCICPAKEDLIRENNDNSMLFAYTYIYISPKEIYQKDFSLNRDSFHSYCKQHHWKKHLVKLIFSKNLTSKNKSKLNYEVNI
jgi:MoaA/NifB/PqqE/SkfB family radical SAM enzyme